jgi:hypothetical protein
MSNAERAIFGSADDAAVAAIDEILPLSIRDNVEFAGRIFREPRGTRFAFTRPIRGTRDDSDPGSRTPPPRLIGFVNIGTYHTHAGSFQETDEIFSPADRAKAVFAKEHSWLGTPHQRILRFTPMSLLPPGEEFDMELKGNVEVLRNVWVIREITITPNMPDP